jgi:AraC-like DNA-binding protein
LILKYQPSSLLADSVELLWYRGGRDSEPAAMRKEAILPDGCAHLVINLSEDIARFFGGLDSNQITSLTGSVFSGPQSSPYAILPTAATVIGVRFRPAGAFPFLRLPVEEFHNIQLPIELVFGKRAVEVRDRLVAARTVQERFALLERFLLQNLCRSARLHPAVCYAIHTFEAHPSRGVSDVLAHLGLSERRFSRVFSEQVGLTPKLFQRVRRFQRLIDSFPSNKKVDWSGTAIDAGYYDQAHLIHEFHAFTSITPGAFLAARIEQRSHLPLRS